MVLRLGKLDGNISHLLRESMAPDGHREQSSSYNYGGNVNKFIHRQKQ